MNRNSDNMEVIMKVKRVIVSLVVLVALALVQGKFISAGQRPDFIINQMPDPPTEKQSDWFRVFGWGNGVINDKEFYWYVFSNRDGTLIFHADTFYLRDAGLWCFSGFKVEWKKPGTELVSDWLWFNRFCDYREGSGWMCESNKTILEDLLNDFPIDLKVEIIETFEYK